MRTVGKTLLDKKKIYSPSENGMWFFNPMGEIESVHYFWRAKWKHVSTTRWVAPGTDKFEERYL